MKKTFLPFTAIMFLTFANFASALEDTPENRIKIAEKLIAETIPTDFVIKMTAMIWNPFVKNINRQNPKISSKVISSLKLHMINQQKKLIAEVMYDLPEIYAQHFTADEMEAILKFKVSPAGRKLDTIVPRITKQAMPKMLQIIEKNIPKIMDSMNQHVKNNGLKL